MHHFIKKILLEKSESAQKILLKNLEKNVKYFLKRFQNTHK